MQAGSVVFGGWRRLKSHFVSTVAARDDHSFAMLLTRPKNLSRRESDTVPWRAVSVQSSFSTDGVQTLCFKTSYVGCIRRPRPRFKHRPAGPTSTVHASQASKEGHLAVVFPMPQLFSIGAPRRRETRGAHLNGISTSAKLPGVAAFTASTTLWTYRRKVGHC